MKLADFGVARALIGDMTAASLIPDGKAGYMSPEQASGDELDGRSDLYAVGSCSGLLTLRRLRVGEALHISCRVLLNRLDRYGIPRPRR